MLISELYGKKIYERNGKRKGVIYAAGYIKDTVCGFYCFDGSEREFFASAEGANVSGEEAYYLTRSSAPEGTVRLRLGIPVFTDWGGYMGKLTDCVYKNHRLTHAVCGGKKYPFESFKIGDAAILKNPAERAGDAAKDMLIAAVCGSAEVKRM